MDFITVLLLITGITVGVVSGALLGSGTIKKKFSAPEKVMVRVTTEEPKDL